MKQTRSQGFTLLELLVAVSIVGILSLIAFAIYTDVQKSGRDTKRRADIDAIASALSTQYTQGSVTPYPSVAPALFSNGIIPSPPGGTAETDYIYVTKSDGNSWVTKTVAGNMFLVCAHLEKSTGNASDANGTFVSTNNGAYYCRNNQL